jgi:hypothetical protein
MKKLIPILILITGCYLPAAKDDFSVLGNDIFSKILIISYTEKRTDYGDGTGVNQINKNIANEISKAKLIGKNSAEISQAFKQAGGTCIRPTDDANKKTLTCSVDKKWQLKNYGSKIDTKNWSNPAARMNYRFVLNNFQIVSDLSLEIIDITEHKDIYTK